MFVTKKVLLIDFESICVRLNLVFTLNKIDLIQIFSEEEIFNREIKSLPVFYELIGRYNRLFPNFLVSETYLEGTNKMIQLLEKFDQANKKNISIIYPQYWKLFDSFNQNFQTRRNLFQLFKERGHFLVSISTTFYPRLQN